MNDNVVFIISFKTNYLKGYLKVKNSLYKAVACNLSKFSFYSLDESLFEKFTTIFKKTVNLQSFTAYKIWKSLKSQILKKYN